MILESGGSSEGNRRISGQRQSACLVLGEEGAVIGSCFSAMGVGEWVVAEQLGMRGLWCKQRRGGDVTHGVCKWTQRRGSQLFSEWQLSVAPLRAEYKLTIRFGLGGGVE